MQVAVFGGTGFLGSHLIKELIARDCGVKLITGNHSKKTSSTSALITHAQVQLDNSSHLEAALAKSEAIVYLSGINRELAPGDFHKVHVENLRMVIAAAEMTNIEKLVYVSFLRARPHKHSNYLQSKWDGESLLRASKLNYTILKPGICFGAKDQMISSIVRGLSLTPLVGMFATVGINETLMSPISATDMAKITADSVIGNRLSRQTFAIVGPEAINMSDAVRRVAKVLSKPVLIVPMPVTAMFAGAWILEHLSQNALVTVSQIRMLADGLSVPTEEAQTLPEDMKPKTYFTEQEIRLAIDRVS